MKGFSKNSKGKFRLLFLLFADSSKILSIVKTMSSPSSSSKQMLNALSEIEPLAFYSPTNTQARPPLSPSPHQDTPDNPFFAIDLNTSAVPTGPAPFQDMFPDNMFEGDIYQNIGLPSPTYWQRVKNS